MNAFSVYRRHNVRAAMLLFALALACGALWGLSATLNIATPIEFITTPIGVWSGLDGSTPDGRQLDTSPMPAPGNSLADGDHDHAATHVAPADTSDTSAGAPPPMDAAPTFRGGGAVPNETLNARLVGRVSAHVLPAATPTSPAAEVEPSSPSPVSPEQDSRRSEPALTPESPEPQFTGATPGELSALGLEYPALELTFSVEALAWIVRQHAGVIIVQANGLSYRFVPGNNTQGLDGGEFLVLDAATKAIVGNRLILISGNGTAHPELRRVASVWAQQIPQIEEILLGLYPNLHHYCLTRQDAARRAVPQLASAPPGHLTTRGHLAINGRGEPELFIDTVAYAGQSYHPELPFGPLSNKSAKGPQTEKRGDR